MKRRYQIERQRAVQQFRRLAAEHNPNVQMLLPLAEIVSLLQQGVANLLRQTGLTLMQLVMEEEVKSLAGERHEQQEGRRAHRWGKEDGYCVVDCQKVPIRRTRQPTGAEAGQLRTVPTGRSDASQRMGQDDARAFDAQLRPCGERFHDAYGIEKSAVSENFIEAGLGKVKELMERPLGELRLCAVLIDGLRSRTAR